MSSTEAKQAEYGDGTITDTRKLIDGQTKYRWRVYAVERSTGLPKRKAGSTIGTLRDAKRDMAAARLEIVAAGPVVDKAMTVSGLMGAFLLAYADQVRPRTAQIAADLSRLYIVPRLGPMKITAVTTPVLQQFHAELKRSTDLERTREQIQSVLSGAFGHAVRLGWLPYSPTEAVRVPKVVKVRVAPEHATLGALAAYDGEEARALQEVAMKAGTVHSYAVAFALYTGMRRGEVYGLKWSDVIRDGGAVSLKRSISDRLGGSVVGDLKTDRSRRTLGLSPKARAVLAAVRQLQVEQGAGEQWEWVFSATPDAMPQPGNVGRAFLSLAKQAGIRKLNFHACRHTFASNAYKEGVPVDEISRYLGHGSELVTRTVYLHVFEDERKAIVIGSYMGGEHAPGSSLPLSPVWDPYTTDPDKHAL